MISAIQFNPMFGGLNSFNPRQNILGNYGTAINQFLNYNPITINFNGYTEFGEGSVFSINIGGQVNIFA